MALRYLVTIALMQSDYLLNAAESGDAIPSQDTENEVMILELTDRFERISESIHQEENRERKLIKNLEVHLALIEISASDPIDDSQKVSALLMMAQRRLPSKLRIPEDLLLAIHQYSDHNEIRTLFQICTSPEDRTQVFGFESYEAMHRRYPSKAAKAEHLNVKQREFRGMPSSLDITIVFDWQWVFIQSISIDTGCGSCSVEERHQLNYNAIGDLAHLRTMHICGLKIAISMEDIQKLPSSLNMLRIQGVVWTNVPGDVDLSLLPRGLQMFSATHCRGMSGLLKLHAPQSNLVTLDVKATALCVLVDSAATFPPSLNGVFLPRNTDVSIVQWLMERGVLPR